MDGGDRERMLAEMFRVCTAGGRILIVDGLVPSSRFNVLGYVLAKLDRGRFKMRSHKFMEMIERAFPSLRAHYEIVTVWPYEFVLVVLYKGQGTGGSVDFKGTGGSVDFTGISTEPAQ